MQDGYIIAVLIVVISALVTEHLTKFAIKKWSLNLEFNPKKLGVRAIATIILSAGLINAIQGIRVPTSTDSKHDTLYVDRWRTDTVGVTIRDGSKSRKGAENAISIVCNEKNVDGKKYELEYGSIGSSGYKMVPVYVINRSAENIKIKEVELKSQEFASGWFTRDWGNGRETYNNIYVYSVKYDIELQEGQDIQLPELSWYVEYYDQTHSDIDNMFELSVFTDQGVVSVKFDVKLKAGIGKPK